MKSDSKIPTAIQTATFLYPQEKKFLIYTVTPWHDRIITHSNSEVHYSKNTDT